MTLGIATVHYLSTLADNKKGSLTNRHQAGVEHVKNDLKMGLTIATPAALTGIAIGTGKLDSIYLGVGKGLVKGVKLVGTALKKSKIGKKLLSYAENLAKNPKKAGAAGLAIAGAIYFISAISKYANNYGRINQKYEDAAKIESQTKNVVLEDRFVKKSKEVKKTENNPMFFE